MPCQSCGGHQAPPDPNRGINGKWSVRWPHGALQPFDTEAAARSFRERHPGKDMRVLPPADPV